MKRFLIILIAIIFVSCSPSTTFVDTSCPGYNSTDFSPTQVASFGIGILPVLGGAEKEQFRRPMGDAITKSFRKEFGENKVRSTNQVISILNDNSLSEEYTKSITGYEISGIIPKKFVLKLGKALDVKYLLFSRLLADTEVSSLQNMDISELYVECKVWDCNLGDVVWEGKGGSAKIESDKNNLVEKTAYGLSKVIGKNNTEWNCSSKEVLVESIDEAKTQMMLASTLGGVAAGLLLVLLIL